MTDTDYRARVEAGMAWLDSFKPGWERDIDLATLNLRSGCDCILGQALRDLAEIGSSGYSYGLPRLPEWDAYGHGFVAVESADYPALEAEWRTAIKARFDSGVLSDDAEVRPA